MKPALEIPTRRAEVQSILDANHSDIGEKPCGENRVAAHRRQFRRDDPIRVACASPMMPAPPRGTEVKVAVERTRRTTGTEMPETEMQTLSLDPVGPPSEPPTRIYEALLHTNSGRGIQVHPEIPGGFRDGTESQGECFASARGNGHSATQ